MSITVQFAKVRNSQGEDAGWCEVSSSQSDSRVFRTGQFILLRAIRRLPLLRSKFS